MNSSITELLITMPPAALAAAKLTALLAAAWALHFALARRAARWRVLLWRGAALGLLALPLLLRLAPALPVALPVPPEPALALPDVMPPLPATLDNKIESAVPMEPEPPLPAEPRPWWIWPAIIWGFGALLLIVRFAYAQRAMRRFVRAAAPAPEDIQSMFDRIARELNVSGVRLAVAEAVRSPLLHGLRRPVVLLPERMTGDEFTDDLPAIFAHELQHAAARDLAWLGLVRLAQLLLWPHPLAWRMHAACAAATERATDAAAAGALRDRESYSRSLARVALALAGRPVGSAALAMAIPDIRRRLLALKHSSASIAPRRAAVRLAALLSLFALVALAALKPIAAEPQETVKIVPLTHVKAADVIGPVRNILAPKPPAQSEFTVEVVPQSNALIVRGPSSHKILEVVELVRQLDQPEENAVLLNDKISISTEAAIPLDQFMKLLAHSTKQDLKYKIAPKIEARVSGNFQNRTVREVLDTVIRPIGLVWDVDRDGTILIWPKDGRPVDARGEPAAAAELVLRIYKINPQYADRIKKLITPFIELPANGKFDLQRKIFIDRDDLIVRDTPENIRKIEELLLDKKFIADSASEKMETVTFSLLPPGHQPDSPPIRAFTARVVEAVKVFLNTQNGEAKAGTGVRSFAYDEKSLKLTITDTPVNLRRVSQYLDSLPELKRKDAAQGSAGLGDALFDLQPADPSLSKDQALAFARRVAEAIKIFLYPMPQEDEARARAVGRSLSLDPGTLRLRVTDTLENILRIRRYIETLPELKMRRSFAPVETGTGTPARNGAGEPVSVNTQQAGTEIVIKRRPGEEVKWRNLTLRILHVAEPRPGEGQVEFEIDNGTQVENRYMQEMATEYIDDYKVTVEDVNVPAGASGTPSARFRIAYIPQRPPANAAKPATQQGGTEVVFKLRQSEEKRWRNLTLHILRVRERRPGEGYVEFTIDNGTQVENRNMQELTTEYIDDYKISVEDVTASATDDGKGSVRMRIKNIPQPTAAPKNAPAISAKITTDSAKASPAPAKKLDIANFSLIPRDAKEVTEPMRKFSEHVVDAIKTFLYSQTGATQAEQEGRRLWFDPKTMQLTIVDTPENLTRIGQYIESLPELGVKTRQEVIFMKYAVSEDLVMKIENALTTTPEARERAKKPDFEVLPGVKVSAFGELNALVVRYQNPKNYQRIVELIKALDQPMQQIEIESSIIKDATAGGKDGKPFDPARDLGASPHAATRIDAAGQRQPVKLAVFSWGGEARLKLLGLERAGRISITARPKTVSQCGEQALVTVGAREPGGNLWGGYTLRMKPALGQKRGGIQLQDIVYSRTERGKTLSTGRYEIELNAGECAAVADPALPGQWVLLAPRPVE